MVSIEEGQRLRNRYERINARIASVAGVWSKDKTLLPEARELLKDINLFLANSMLVRNTAPRGKPKAQWDVVRAPLIKARGRLSLATSRYA